MNNEVLVSVIIPVYNHENYVQKTIKSIINQTYKNIELILIDDGSKDNSYQKILELKEECNQRFSNVIIKTKENEGTCKTYNKLISMCSGKYIYIIASDDISKPDAIKKEVEFLENNSDYVLVVGNNEVIDTEGNLKQKETSTDIMSKLKKINFNSEDFGTYSTLFFIGNYIPNGYLVRADLLKEKVHFTKEAPLEDWYEMLQLSKYGKFKYIDEILFSYRVHGENTFTQAKKMRNMARQTLKYEVNLLKKLDLSNCLPEVAKTRWQYKYLGKIAKFLKKFELKRKYKN